jgi:hypothetical protein
MMRVIQVTRLLAVLVLFLAVLAKMQYLTPKPAPEPLRYVPCGSDVWNKPCHDLIYR